MDSVIIKYFHWITTTTTREKKSQASSFKLCVCVNNESETNLEWTIFKRRRQTIFWWKYCQDFKIHVVVVVEWWANTQISDCSKTFWNLNSNLSFFFNENHIPSLFFFNRWTSSKTNFFFISLILSIGNCNKTGQYRWYTRSKVNQTKKTLKLKCPYPIANCALELWITNWSKKKKIDLQCSFYRFSFLFHALFKHE